ncbi:MAG: polysaccharide biosynthesis/export family protein, partial [Candidatus Omnitrophota bacterium]|nr:polysaccharide biosynthesis/export family protein [Candidatus Omnitrophota bacterium]
MIGGTIKIILTLFTGLSAILLSSCAYEARGVPVKEFRPTIAVQESDAKQKNEMKEGIIRASQVKENSVFTERRGVPEYIIGPGDILTINLREGSKINTYDALVRPDGKISYSFIDNITVSGHTAGEVNEIVTEALKKYIREPRLEIVIKEYKSKSVLLFGQINVLQQGTSGPGKYPLLGKTRVLDLIVAAGGAISGKETGGNADLRQVELVRQGKRYSLNLYNAMFRGDVSDNVVLDNGDTITVPEMPTYAERVYVFGQVKSQGILKLKDSQDLLTAIALSGGTTPVAIKADIKIIREYQERQGKPLILSANLDQILLPGDLAQNIRLKDGDVIYVPRSVIGDINEFITILTPSLDFIYNRPSTFRTNYM